MVRVYFTRAAAAVSIALLISAIVFPLGLKPKRDKRWRIMGIGIPFFSSTTFSQNSTLPVLGSLSKLDSSKQPPMTLKDFLAETRAINNFLLSSLLIPLLLLVAVVLIAIFFSLQIVCQLLTGKINLFFVPYQKIMFIIFVAIPLVGRWLHDSQPFFFLTY